MQYFACKIPKFYLDGELIWIAVTLAESEFTTIFWGVGDPWMHQNTLNILEYPLLVTDRYVIVLGVE